MHTTLLLTITANINELLEAYQHWIVVDYEQKTRLYECLEAFEREMVLPPPGEPLDADIPQKHLLLPPG
jgi:hypothetical protein